MTGADISEVETRASATSARGVEHARSDDPIASGQMLGRYVVLEQVGSGAFGRVLRAYDSKLEREVALKLLDRNALAERTQARVVNEARAMAKLSHPNVVSVFDVEDTALGVVLVMEYVGGRTLRAWLRDESPGWERVVARLCEAGRGLAAAHGSEILHLDFKPSNVLIPRSGQAKVADFGIARIVPGIGSEVSSIRSQERVAPSDDMTRQGSVIGTPRYMAPEQHRNEQLQPAADQYAFCVAMWEALTGAPPFRGPVAKLAELKDEGPPPWPEGVAVPRSIVAALRRGLAPDPLDRWPSMTALLRVLDDDPRRRWRTGLTVAGAVGLLGVGALVARLWGGTPAEVCSGARAQLQEVWSDARRDAIEAAFLETRLPYAAPTWSRLEQALDDYGQAWERMHTEACEATTVRGEQSAVIMDLRMACLERARRSLSAIVDVLATADSDVVERAHPIVDGLEPLGPCEDVTALRADGQIPPPAEAERVDQIRDALARARARQDAGRFDDAQAHVDRAVALLSESTYAPVIAEVDLERGILRKHQGEYPAAEAHLLDALQAASRRHRWSLMRSAALELMRVVGKAQAHPDQGLRYRELIFGLSEQDPRALLEARIEVGILLLDQGEYAEADAELARARQLDAALDPPDPAQRARLYNNLGISAFRQGKYAEAVTHMRRAVDLQCERRGQEHPECVTRRRNLATILTMQGQYAEAEAELRGIIDLLARAYGDDHPEIANALMTLAVALRRQGRPDQAEAELRKALAIQLASLGPEHPQVAMTYNNLANAFRDQGLHDRAEQEDRRALEVRMKTLPAEHPDIALARGSLGDSLQAQGKTAEAIREYRASLPILEQSLGEEHPNTNTVRDALATSLLEAGQAEEALSLAERTYALTRRDDIAGIVKGAATLTLARALWDSGRDRARAVTLAQQAREQLTDDPTLLETAEAWLREHEGQATPDRAQAPRSKPLSRRRTLKMESR